MKSENSSSSFVSFIITLIINNYSLHLYLILIWLLKERKRNTAFSVTHTNIHLFVNSSVFNKII